MTAEELVLKDSFLFEFEELCAKYSADVVGADLYASGAPGVAYVAINQPGENWFEFLLPTPKRHT